jgi:predicted dehydrogenase
VRAWATYEDVLADGEVEAVALTVRAPDQGALAACGLRAGKHVHAEVPAAHSITDCESIVDAVHETGAIYCLAEQTRNWGFVQEWRRLVSEGTLGTPLLVDGQYFHYLPDDKFADDDGGFIPLDRVGPNARPTWQQLMPPIHYVPHELSPLLHVLDDRVVEVTGMSTPSPSRADARIIQPDVQVATMRTAKGTIIRLAVGFSSPHPEGDWHWYQVVGTAGSVEWRRRPDDEPKLYIAGRDQALQNVDWRYERSDAPIQAGGSGHGDADYYVHTQFRDAVRGLAAAPMTVYQAVETAAPAIVAAESIARGGVPLTVPDFRDRHR